MILCSTHAPALGANDVDEDAGSLEPILIEELHFEGLENNTPRYHVKYTVRQIIYRGSSAIKIDTEFTGPAVMESNRCITSPKLAMRTMIQRTVKPDENIEWQIDNTGSLAKAYWKDYTTLDTKSATFTLPADGLTIQVLIYYLQQLNMEKKFPLSFKLLVPMAQLWGMEAAIVGTEELALEDQLAENGNFENNTVKCWKIEINPAGFIGWFSPKSHFWLTATYPHIPVKYISNDITFRLKHMTLNFPDTPVPHAEEVLLPPLKAL